jgi:multicomponent Na+:H+ antiporter subunit F
MDWTLIVVFAILSLSLFMAVVRLLLGPTLADRVVALDLIAFIATAMIAGYAIMSEHAALIETALVIALIAFMGTIAFARYVERANIPAEEERA